MGGNREFTQGLHLHLDAQGTILRDLQIARNIHHRFRGNAIARLIVKQVASVCLVAIPMTLVAATVARKAARQKHPAGSHGGFC